MAAKKKTRIDLPSESKRVAMRKRKTSRLSVPQEVGFGAPDGMEQYSNGIAVENSSQRTKKSGAFGKPKVHVSQEPAWVKLSDRKLLELRISDFELEFEKTGMVEFRDQLHREIKQKGLLFKPHCWFSDDWFSPDKIPGIAVPFYLAHRRLMRLERNQMLQVEGGTKPWCMRIMRHEAGHAIDTAFRLHRKRGYKEIFGSYSTPYPETYRPKPRSKDFVFHLEPWYAQSHPAEDFAETFAVWLTPNSRWRKDYQGWPALKKLKFVDELMQRIEGQKQAVSSRAKIDPARRIDTTLKHHYEERRQFYNLESASIYDDELTKLFRLPTEPHQKRTAAGYLQKNKNEFCSAVVKWSGEYRHNVNQLIREMTERCRVLKLFLPENDERLKQECMLMLTVQTMNFLKHRHRVAL
jgi:hypothetical protein